MWSEAGIKSQERIKGLILPKGIHIKSKDFDLDKNDRQSLNYMWPEASKGKLSVIVDIHGGGFICMGLRN